MISKLKKLILKGFVKDCGLVAQPKIYRYEGKPYTGYVIYHTSIFFWVKCYKFYDAIPEIEQLHIEYPKIKIIY
jgi:hypothetical protein